MEQTQTASNTAQDREGGDEAALVVRGRGRLLSGTALSGRFGVAVWTAVGTLAWVGVSKLMLAQTIPAERLASSSPVEVMTMLTLAALPPALLFGLFAGRQRRDESIFYDKFQDDIRGAIVELESRGRALRRSGDRVHEGVDAALAQMASAAIKLAETAEQVAATARAAEEARGSLESSADRASGIASAFRDAAIDLRKEAAAALGATGEISRHVQAMTESLGEARSSALASVGDVAGIRDRLAETLADGRSAQIQAAENITAAREAAASIAVAVREAAQSVASQVAALAAVREDLQEAVSTTSDVVRHQGAMLTVSGRKAVEAASSISEVIEGGISRLQGLSETLRSAAGAISSDISGATQEMQAAADGALEVSRSASTEAREMVTQADSLAQRIRTIGEVSSVLSERIARVASDIEGAVRRIEEVEQGAGANVTSKIEAISLTARQAGAAVAAQVEDMRATIAGLDEPLARLRQNCTERRDEVIFVGESFREQVDGILASLRGQVSRLEAEGIATVRALDAAAVQATTAAEPLPRTTWAPAREQAPPAPSAPLLRVPVTPIVRLTAAEQVLRASQDVAGRLRVKSTGMDAAIIAASFAIEPETRQAAQEFCQTVLQDASDDVLVALETPCGDGLPTPRDLYTALRDALRRK